jgi:hypothetical protein
MTTTTIVIVVALAVARTHFLILLPLDGSSLSFFDLLQSFSVMDSSGES